jgi:hypothetical protein
MFAHVFIGFTVRVRRIAIIIKEGQSIKHSRSTSLIEGEA